MERRNFVKKATVGSAALAATAGMPVFGADHKLRIGVIGVGWYGMVDAKAALKIGGVEIVAICDIDSEHLSSSADELTKLQGSKPLTFKDYRELLEMKGLEAVIIGTPPHWHALQFIAACEKKLDIYCEKPLAYDIQEGMAMVRAAQKAGNIVQIGFQRRQSGAYKKAKELISNGTIGNVHQINTQIYYNPGPQDHSIQSPPPSLDWENWCGPAPKLDYRPNIGHKAWRLEKEYGNGHLVDWGIHHIDIIRKIIDETIPTEVYTKGGTYEFKDKITTPDTLIANFAFKKAQVTWQHRLWGTGDPIKVYNNGIFFHGDKATLFVEDSKVNIYWADKNKMEEEYLIPSPFMQEKHLESFLNAVKNKDKNQISCTIEDAFQSTATVQLAMISYNTGSLIKWDKEQKTIIGNPSATKLLKREYRGKYQHP